MLITPSLAGTTASGEYIARLKEQQGEILFAKITIRGYKVIFIGGGGGGNVGGDCQQMTLKWIKG
jgi:hypothetical protein